MWAPSQCQHPSTGALEASVAVAGADDDACCLPPFLAGGLSSPQNLFLPTAAVFSASTVSRWRYFYFTSSTILTLPSRLVIPLSHLICSRTRSRNPLSSRAENIEVKISPAPDPPSNSHQLDKPPQSWFSSVRLPPCQRRPEHGHSQTRPSASSKYQQSLASGSSHIIHYISHNSRTGTSGSLT